MQFRKIKIFFMSFLPTLVYNLSPYLTDIGELSEVTDRCPKNFSSAIQNKNHQYKLMIFIWLRGQDSNLRPID